MTVASYVNSLQETVRHCLMSLHQQNVLLNPLEYFERLPVCPRPLEERQPVGRSVLYRRKPTAAKVQGQPFCYVQES